MACCFAMPMTEWLSDKGRRKGCDLAVGQQGGEEKEKRPLVIADRVKRENLPEGIDIREVLFSGLLCLPEKTKRVQD